MEEIASIIRQDRVAMYENQAPIEGSLTLGDVLARAIHYNLEYRAEMLNNSISHKQYELAKYDMLPSLAADAGYVSRSNVSASRSVSIFTNNETLEPSTSQDRDHIISKLKFSWNILDFGVSYFQAKQEADRALIAINSRKKVLNSIMQQAMSAYWNAYLAQELKPKVDSTLIDARKAVRNIDTGLAAKAYPSPVDALKLKKQLVESINALESINDVLGKSTAALKSLINARSVAHLELKGFNIESKLPAIFDNRERLELLALEQSLDVQNQMYNARIEYNETKKAFARMLPGIELSFNNHYDSNSFIYNNHWGEAGLQVSFNLLKLASSKDTLETAELREALVKQKRLALNMAVITRMNLAMNQYESSVRKMKQVETLKDIDEQINSMTNNTENQTKSLVEKVQVQVAALQSTMGFNSVQTSVREAESAVFSSLGLSPVPENYLGLNLDELSVAIETNIHQWYSADSALNTPQQVVLLDQAARYQVDNMHQ